MMGLTFLALGVYILVLDVVLALVAWAITIAGWNSFVREEHKVVRRNFARSSLLGSVMITTAVVIIYLLF